MHNFKLALPPNFYVGTKAELVVEAIRTAILTGDILPGSRITEQQVKAELNVSSSPVREAFHQLEAEGLLTRSPHIGTTVTSMEIEDAKELYRIQALLQSTALQICCNRLTDADIAEAKALNDEIKKLIRGKIDVKLIRVVNYKLHMILCGKNVYPWLTRLISGLWIMLPTQSVWLAPQRPLHIVREHEKILNAVEKKDGMRAGALMQEHLKNSQSVLFGKQGKSSVSFSRK